MAAGFAWRAAVERYAAISVLDPNLVHAIIQQESDEDPTAWNPEPRYRYFWNVRTQAPFRLVTTAEIASETPPKDFPSLAGDPDQEWWAQQASWGLMQIMGAVAREHGFRAAYLTRLVTDPETNIAIGCVHFARLLAWAGTYTAKADDPRAIAGALAAYNGGKVGNAPTAATLRNGEYARQVLVRYQKLQNPARG